MLDESKANELLDDNKSSEIVNNNDNDKTTIDVTNAGTVLPPLTDSVASIFLETQILTDHVTIHQYNAAIENNQGMIDDTYLYDATVPVFHISLSGIPIAAWEQARSHYPHSCVCTILLNDDVVCEVQKLNVPRLGKYLLAN